ncbi:uncharacterized protein DUF4276 [Frondihabitans sp. PhB188]|uniref:DUF4276 family protein n=1 Tax=Frondihabitans sp. PhB188 TaxID=2485200 RepID=UPI000F4729DF|nr:DUF4276 family protein [Frondihabitans sp. PhB188]ROQ31001.1 uncharacterized protein DUF4276 [Frondihabitans sp. PhB188]
MKIALVTEGESEWTALPGLVAQLKSRTGHEFIPIMRLRVQPDGPVEKIARTCAPTLKICALKGVDKIVILLDREQQATGPGFIAASITAAVKKVSSSKIPVAVVIKDRSFENWVIADLAALKAQPARFKIKSSMEKAVSPNKADQVEALALLKAATIGQNYDKIQDSKRTLAKAKVERVAKNSRSFRHFLHVLGDQAYEGQCKAP